MSEEQTNEQAVEMPHSVEIAYNKDGKASGKVKCYAKTPEEAMEATLKWSEELYKVIKVKNGI